MNKLSAKLRIGKVLKALIYQLLITLTLLPCNLTIASDTSKIILSYGGFLPKNIEITGENLKFAMFAPNVVEFDNIRLDEAIVSWLALKNKKTLMRINLFIDKNGKLNLFSKNQIMEKVQQIYLNKNIDGLSIDEIDYNIITRYGLDEELIIEMWSDVLMQIRKDYPQKLLFTWLATYNMPTKLYLKIYQYSDYVIAEVYYRQSIITNIPNYQFPKYRQWTVELERLQPGSTKKCILGLVMDDRYFDSNKSYDNHVLFIKNQLKSIYCEGLIDNVAGIALVSPLNTNKKIVSEVDTLLLNPVHNLCK